MDTKSIHFSVWVSHMLRDMNYTPLLPLFLSPESHISFSILSLQSNIRLSSTKKHNSSIPLFGATGIQIAFALFHRGLPGTGNCSALTPIGPVTPASRSFTVLACTFPEGMNIFFFSLEIISTVALLTNGNYFLI